MDNELIWKEISLEDKILFIMKNICNILAVVTLITFAYFIDKDLSGNVILLFLISIAFIACGKSAASSIDFYKDKQKNVF